jgi:hypothetical protein
MGKMEPCARRNKAHLDISNQHGEQKQSTSHDKDAKGHLKCVVRGCQCIAKRAAPPQTIYSWQYPRLDWLQFSKM